MSRSNAPRGPGSFSSGNDAEAFAAFYNEIELLPLSLHLSSFNQRSPVTRSIPVVAASTDDAQSNATAGSTSGLSSSTNANPPVLRQRLRLVIWGTTPDANREFELRPELDHGMLLSSLAHHRIVNWTLLSDERFEPQPFTRVPVTHDATQQQSAYENAGARGADFSGGVDNALHGDIGSHSEERQPGSRGALDSTKAIDSARESTNEITSTSRVFPSGNSGAKAAPTQTSSSSGENVATGGQRDEITLEGLIKCLPFPLDRVFETQSGEIWKEALDKILQEILGTDIETAAPNLAAVLAPLSGGGSDGKICSAQKAPIIIVCRLCDSCTCDGCPQGTCTCVNCHSRGIDCTNHECHKAESEFEHNAIAAYGHHLFHTHLSLKPFKCRYCTAKSFPWKSSRDFHEEVQHPDRYRIDHPGKKPTKKATEKRPRASTKRGPA